MKKLVIILVIVLVLMFMLASPVFAKQPTYGEGWWDNFGGPTDPETYDIHSGTIESPTPNIGWEGTISQPVKPGLAQKAMFVGTVDDIPGTCLLNVRTFSMKNNKWVMSGAVVQCYGDLTGLQATFKGSLDDFENFTGSFESWYHFEAKPIKNE